MKKWIVLLLAALLLLSLACAKGKTNTDTNTTETQEDTTVDKTHPIATITMKGGGAIVMELYPEVAPENGVQNDISHVRGVLSMARSSAYDSAGSQFFIVQTDSTYLDGNYAAFGRVTSGMDVVDAIARTTTDSKDKPYKDQVMETVRVETWGVEYGEPEKLPGK